MPTQWEDSPEMAGDKEQSEHKSSLLSAHLASAVPAQLFFPSPISPKASSAFWELRICPKPTEQMFKLTQVCYIFQAGLVLFYRVFFESFVASFI